MEPSTAVRSVRHAAGLSQRALALRAAVPQSTVARIELGVLDPRSGTVDRLLRAAGYELVPEARPGAGVDRSQIQERLRLSPRARIDANVDAARAVERLRGRARRRR
jgi:transcriptional regulator with XRE-family HTH domain